ncbi:hypothetical protein GCM10011581_30890 [Saccharopolyspora subtropica]|uniref:Uncharacterized protein n=1 Tax=Saccharopolyspora thermophila TaxID=89367 RepID=A0A917JXX4_9PSEU|nr:hypothetical protein GCM10011581_30890 [Saccharopolyspora subtropica]
MRQYLGCRPRQRWCAHKINKIPKPTNKIIKKTIGGSRPARFPDRRPDTTRRHRHVDVPHTWVSERGDDRVLHCGSGTDRPHFANSLDPERIHVGSPVSPVNVMFVRGGPRRGPDGVGLVGEPAGGHGAEVGLDAWEIKDGL